ncbi:MAG: pyroglutamyl-peptidase I [Burkholderiaceae bacterium]|nr:pyroglutamyl-peptidase I [Microbacteriaceae bacterium]
MPTVLLTGFEPFGGETTNPSWTAVRGVLAAWDGAAALLARRLPVAFDLSGPALATALEETCPDIVICVGQAGGATGIRLERVAINLDDARIADNTGHQPIDEPIVPGGPSAYFATLPVKAAVAAIGALGIPAEVSHSAGTYACNHVFYLLMHKLEQAGHGARGGFVHVPFGPDQTAGTDRPSLPIGSMVAALTAVVETALSTRTDLAVVGGALH